MISKLSKQQEEQIPIYLDKWLKIGLRTESVDEAKAKEAAKFYYEEILDRNTPEVLILASPEACQKYLNEKRSSQLDSQLDSQLYSPLYSQLRSQLNSQLYSQLNSQLNSQLYSQLDYQLSSQLDSQLNSQLRSQQLEFFYPSRSNWYMSYYAMYDYILNELFPEKKQDFKLFLAFLEYSKEFHQLYMMEDYCLISDFPKAICLNSKGELHSVESQALAYRDGTGVYAINGNCKDSLVEMVIDSCYNQIV